MKKNLLLLCLPALAIILTPSCMKQDLPDKHEKQAEPIVITVELLKNQTYQYTLPQNLSDDPFKVTMQAEHYIASDVSNDKVYTYTPALDYIGKDRVVIANAEEQHGNNNNGCGNNNNNGNCNHNNIDNNNNGCGNHHEDEIEQTITINFIIKDKEQGKHLRAVICPSF